jgi:hypothetical protein
MAISLNSTAPTASKVQQFDRVSDKTRQPRIVPLSETCNKIPPQGSVASPTRGRAVSGIAGFMRSPVSAMR